jgi:hypothetical protein
MKTAKGRRGWVRAIRERQGVGEEELLSYMATLLSRPAAPHLHLIP